eukprot:Hpha_TRINITY_DN14114_c0_g2::TRINITY_DN14114_c0_g2_i1::g.10537::m.10537
MRTPEEILKACRAGRVSDKLLRKERVVTCAAGADPTEFGAPRTFLAPISDQNVTGCFSSEAKSRGKGFHDRRGMTENLLAIARRVAPFVAAALNAPPVGWDPVGDVRILFGVQRSGQDVSSTPQSEGVMKERWRRDQLRVTIDNVLSVFQPYVDPARIRVYTDKQTRAGVLVVAPPVCGSPQRAYSADGCYFGWTPENLPRKAEEWELVKDPDEALANRASALLCNYQLRLRRRARVPSGGVVVRLWGVSFKSDLYALGGAAGNYHVCTGVGEDGKAVGMGDVPFFAPTAELRALAKLLQGRVHPLRKDDVSRFGAGFSSKGIPPTHIVATEPNTDCPATFDQVGVPVRLVGGRFEYQDDPGIYECGLTTVEEGEEPVSPEKLKELWEAELQQQTKEAGESLAEGLPSECAKAGEAMARFANLLDHSVKGQKNAKKAFEKAPGLTDVEVLRSWEAEEDERTEFKASTEHMDAYSKVACAVPAFLNAGSTPASIYFGVDDVGKCVGQTVPDAKRMELDNMVRRIVQKVRPPLHPSQVAYGFTWVNRERVDEKAGLGKAGRWWDTPKADQSQDATPRKYVFEVRVAGYAQTYPFWVQAAGGRAWMRRSASMTLMSEALQRDRLLAWARGEGGGAFNFQSAARTRAAEGLLAAAGMATAATTTEAEGVGKRKREEEEEGERQAPTPKRKKKPKRKSAPPPVAAKPVAVVEPKKPAPPPVAAKPAAVLKKPAGEAPKRKKKLKGKPQPPPPAPAPPPPPAPTPAPKAKTTRKVVTRTIVKTRKIRIAKKKSK